MNRTPAPGWAKPRPAFSAAERRQWVLMIGFVLTAVLVESLDVAALTDAFRLIGAAAIIATPVVWYEQCRCMRAGRKTRRRPLHTLAFYFVLPAAASALLFAVLGDALRGYWVSLTLLWAGYSLPTFLAVTLWQLSVVAIRGACQEASAGP